MSKPTYRTTSARATMAAVDPKRPDYPEYQFNGRTFTAKDRPGTPPNNGGRTYRDTGTMPRNT